MPTHIAPIICVYRRNIFFLLLFSYVLMLVVLGFQAVEWEVLEMCAPFESLARVGDQWNNDGWAMASGCVIVMK